MGNEIAGTVLLLAAAPGGRGRLVDATAVLPGLAAVPAGVLTGTETATLIELADPVDPHAVLSRVRTAAAAPGPLVLVLAGQLQLDPRQHRLHLALARTTHASTRYTALPWHWLVSELALRAPETTTALLDLAADAESWPTLRRQGLTLGPGVRVYGRVSPPPPRRRMVTLARTGVAAHAPSVPEYLSRCVALWRGGARPALPELHEYAAQAPGGEDALLLSVDTPAPPAAPPPSGTPQVPADPAAAPVAPAAPATPAAPAAPAVPEAPTAPVVPTDPGDRAAARRVVRPVGEVRDPLAVVLASARAGRHAEAASLAAVSEAEALRAHGPGSAQALQWLEVRADLARLAQDPAASCQLWMTAAEARLTVGQSAQDAEVEAAVDRAHHQWEQVRDTDEALGLAARLAGLRATVPGRQPGAARLLDQRLTRLRGLLPST
ncbi:hypothetical protein [Streptomyces iconiensis]|uniref:Uncharacterized protein n=1 Tax=Streptomyces iconiensis TaxID=1384038 RepID=A0ABT6ZQ51_9ACTN|nr:hypothetical protein [Streptomyces iconiensis]MDJ1131178.1 hypothetical protein [Streptomyces iconiensis]